MVLKEEGGPNTGEGNRTRGGSPKKAKPNKIPQRGLGIAALEKLRREEQQKKIDATFATGDSIASSNGGSTSNHCTAGVISHSLKPQLSPAAPYLPMLNPSTSLRPCYIGNYALFRPPIDAGDGTAPLLWNSVQSERFMNHNLQLPLASRWQPRTPPLPDHQQHQEQQRYSLAMKDFLSPPLPSESGAAGLQMELPSNQSYVSMNSPMRTEEQRLVSMKRPWPFHSPMITHYFDHGNELKRTALTREDASGSNHGGRIDLGRKVKVGGGEDAELDGSFLSLGPSKQSPRQTVTLHQHYMRSLKSNPVEKGTAAEGSLRWTDNVIGEQQTSAEAVRPRRPLPLYNFMELPHDLIGNKPGDAN